MSISDKLDKIDKLQAEIDAFGPLSSEIKKLINYKFRLDWNYFSNAMEGGTLSREETRSVMIGNISIEGKPLRDIIEMNGHDEIVKEVLAIGRGNSRISEARIKAIHRAIMHEEEEEKKQKIGQWKKEYNEIINYRGEKFGFTPPNEVPERVHQLLNQTNAAIDALQGKKQIKHPVQIALDFHLEYVTIHPFYDGNGRTARILTNLILIANGYPPIIIKTSEKEIYYQYLADIQAYGGDPDLFFGFMADLVIRSQKLVLAAIAGEDISETSDWEKELSLLKQKAKGMEEVQSKTDELIFQRFQDSIHPLFEKAKVKLAKFDELFAKTNTKEDALDSSNLSAFIGYQERIEGPKDKGILSQLRSFNLTFDWIGYKGAGIAIFNMDAIIQVDLQDEFKYVISTTNKTIPPIEKLYTKELTDIEMEVFIDQLGAVLVDTLKRRAEEN